MKRLEVGKLYSCSEYFLLLYPDKDTASAVGLDAAMGSCPTRTAAYWSRKFDKPVSYCNPLTPLLVLSVNEKYVEVLAEDKRGWIINENWLEIKEIS
jgi:hypothetical protein